MCLIIIFLMLSNIFVWGLGREKRRERERILPLKDVYNIERVDRKGHILESYIHEEKLVVGDGILNNVNHIF